MAVMTDARLALWAAIDNYAPLAGAFQHTMRFAEDSALIELPEPSQSDLNCLAILPVAADTTWLTNQSQAWPLTLPLVLWVGDWNLADAEELFEKLIVAIYKSTPEGSSVPYVKAATGYYPEKVGPVNFELTRLADGDQDTPGTKAIKVTLNVVLKVNRNPFL